jgi:tetratricopeptide (TPR) repeat protein
VREEGKAKWEVGGQKSTTEPKLAGTLFLGAPLPHENELLILGELNSDLFLHSIEPETGKLLWRQPLTTNYSTIANDLLRRSTGAVPAIDGSIVICPTLSGYLVAYDKASRSILWAFKYPIRPDLTTSNQASAFGGQMDLADLSPLTPRSADNSVVISDGVVLFAPADGVDAYGIQIEDGALLWKITNSNATPIRYIAGAWNNTAVVVCQNAIVAVDLKSGKAKWPKLELPDSQQVIGRGVRKQGMYLLPTSGQNILQIDLLKGAIADSVQVEQPLGNLISVGDRLICATPFELDCYSVREAFQSQLKEELQRNSNSVVGLVRQSELALAKGEFDSALDYLEQAKKIDPNNDVILLINKAGIAALTADFDKYVDRVDLLGNLIVDRDKAPYLRLLIKGYQKQGKNKETLAALFEISNLRTSQRQEQMSGVANVELSTQWSVQEDRWIATQFRNVIAKLTPKELADLELQVELELEAMRKMPSHVRRVKLAHFDSIRETEEMRLESAKTLVLQRDYLQAERLLASDLLSEDVSSNAIDVAARRDILASIYVRI